MDNCTTNKYFHKFSSDIKGIALPENFTYPFDYRPHELAKLASQQVQDYLKSQNGFSHDFGLTDPKTAAASGKMFGVLIVEQKNGEIGFLAAYSGKLENSLYSSYFVPPVYDHLDENGFFIKEEKQISAINQTIELLAKAPQLKVLNKKYDWLACSVDNHIKDFKALHKANKASRKKLRKQADDNLESTKTLELYQNLENQSHYDQYIFKTIKAHWKKRLKPLKSEIDKHNRRIANLKEERKLRSAALQNKLFAHYEFLNYAGQKASLLDIFKHRIPPSGAGACAAPKLLNYAYKNGMKPIAMAEYWWGKSPSSEIRFHGNYYPSCKSKCEPILNHMLLGLSVDPNPLSLIQAPSKLYDIVFEDEAVIIINKQPNVLSVPGKQNLPSVQIELAKQYPDIETLWIVHRLDMATSGIIIFAKTKDYYTFLQKQFLDNRIQKRYIAVLEGRLAQKNGEINLPLRVDLDNRPMQLVCYEHGKDARTHYQVLDYSDYKTRVHFFPITGRTHQLRVHAAHPNGLSCAIVGDDLYGKRDERLFLHAEYISFIHPVTLKRVEFKVEAPF